ncbi:hypothetical protein EH223_18210 [candidate division KSB1 bacterium]|nr:hypothetical protein [candidate division KSB1 bacterium]RQW00678.1 MAG: hypothetical protein EH223_18210 [candidate division KSB1 bacterium]
MKQNTPTYDKLVANLKSYHRKDKSLQALRQVLYFLMAAAPAVFLFVLLESAFQLSVAGRTVSLSVLLLMIAVLGFLFLGRAIRYFLSLFHPDMVAIALRVGRYYKNIDDRLVNALQLYENFERDRDKYSISLIEAALSQVGDILARERFSAKVETQKVKNAVRYAAGVALFTLVPVFSFGSFFSAGFFRLVHPRQNFVIRPAITFVVKPGDTQVIKGDDVLVSAWVSDTTVMSLSLKLQNRFGENKIDLNRAKSDSFTYTISNVRDSLRYSFFFQDFASPVHSIFPIERPVLRSLNVKIEPPAYANIDPYILEENIGDISALKGSKISLSGLANKNLSSGYLLFSDEQKSDLAMQGRRIAAAFNVSRDDFYTIHLMDQDGYSSLSPIKYQINVIPDNFPIVRIIRPGKDIDLEEDMTIPLAIEAEDDFGISQLRLAYQLIPGGEGDIDSSRFVYSDIQDFNYGEDLLRVMLNWDLSQLDMFPTDVLVYFVQVYDADMISGPKSARSTVYRARFPSLYEMYEEMANDQDEVTTSFEETLEKTRALQNKLDDLTLEMKRTIEMDWQQKQEIDEAVQQQRDIEQQIEQMTQQLDEMIEKMEKNDLFTAETIEKFQEIQQLYQDLMTPELEDTMRKMSEAMQNLNEEMIRQAMEKLKLNADDYNKALDRTISLLKKLKAEQKLDQALKMAQDLADRQSDITEGSQKQQAEHERLQKEQERINQDADALSQVLDELQRESKEIPMLPSEQINDAAAEMQSQNFQENLDALQNMLAQNQMAAAPKTSSNIQKSFEKMASNLEMAKQMMSGEMQRQAMQAMRKLSRELLQLSKQQEELMQQTRDVARNSSEYPELANRQQEIASGLDRVTDEMSAVMNESFGIDPQVSQSLGKAMAHMDTALREMENRNASNASENQGSSMANINSAIRRMQQSMQNMQQQGGSGGMSYQQFLQQMQQLAGAQGQINQQTPQAGSNGQLSLGQQAALARLAAEQRQVRKSMEELAREAEGMSEVLGSLDKIAEDMKKVEQDFANNNISRDTINRQNRILSRMLDAQKSVHRREFSRERKAETGKNYVTTSPDALPADLGERKNQLEQDLLRAKKEGYSRDYLKVIEEYFKALTEHDISTE